MLLEKIRNDALMSRKNARRADATEAEKAFEAIRTPLLSTLVSEISIVGKNEGRETTDAEAEKVVRDFLKNVNFTMSKRPDDKVAPVEQKILSAYLPAQVSEGELRTGIEGIVAELEKRDPSQMKVVMGRLKEKFGANYDGKLASDIVKGLLK